MSHTKEPWSYEVSDHADEYSCDVFDGNDHSIIDGSNGLITEANARRIVACVNACAGIPTDQLEAYPGAVMRVMKERDELLAEMQKAREDMSCANFNSAAGRIDHAIASVKGGAA